MSEEGEGMGEDELIRRKLFVKEEDILSRLDSLLTRVESYLSIESATGTIIVKRTNLPARDKIGLILMGRYFYSKGKGEGERSLSLSEIGRILMKPVTSLSGPINDLMKAGYVEKISSGRYQIAYYKIEDFLNELEKHV